MNDLVTIRTYDNYITAHIVRGRLEDSGIPVYIQDEHTVTMYWIASQAVGGIRLQVKKEDQQMAEELLAEDDAAYHLAKEQPAYQEPISDQIDTHNKVCIYCGSHNTKEELFQKKWAYAFILFLGFPLAVRDKKWFCFNCSKKF